MVSRRLDLSQSKNSPRKDNIQNFFHIAIEKILSLHIMIKKIKTGICKKKIVNSNFLPCVYR